MKQGMKQGMIENHTPDIIVMQPGIPSYRVDFFARLAAHYGSRFRVYASPLNLGVLTDRVAPFEWEHALGPIRPLPIRAVDWQERAMSVPMKAGDVLVLWGAPRSLSNILTMARARACRVKVIWWGHYLSPTSRPWRQALRTVLMRGASALLFYTDREVEAYRQSRSGRKDRRPVLALNNGVNTDPINALRAPYIAASREQAALFIGRLTAKAKLRLALEAMAMDPSSNLKLHVLGDGDERAALERHAQELGISDRVHWHGGTADEARIAAVANRCRIFLYPGDVGLSVIHAMAYGLPAVLHDRMLGHMPEIAILNPGRNGVTFPENDVRGLARVLAEIGTATDLLDTMSTAALESIRNDFNTARMAERFIAGVADVLETA